MIIEYFIKSVYGNDLKYIAKEDQAKAVQMLTGQKTLTTQAIAGLQRLGFELKQVLPV